MNHPLLDLRLAAVALGLCALTAAVAHSQQPATKSAVAEKAKVAAPAAKTATKATAEVKKQPVAVAKAARLRPANDDAQLNALAAQFMPQFRHVLRAEFQVVRVVCNPTPDQAKKVARQAEKSFPAAVRKYAEGMRRPMNAEQRTANDPHKLIQETLLQVILTQLSSEQASRYHEEIARQADHRKQLAIRNLVVKLDKELVLNTPQREKLAESLRINWSDSWNVDPNMFVYENAFIPLIPESAVAPILNESQKKVWRTIPRNNLFFNQFMMDQFGNLDDPLLEDPDLREARLAEAANGEKHAK